MRPSARPKVVGTGLIALDFVLGPEKDEPIRYWAGGTCGNVLAIMAYLGWDSFPVARMNGDAAARRVRADFARWGVHLNWTNCAPTTDTPIVVQRIRRAADGEVRHAFSWSCPHCGQWLPPFRAITLDAVPHVRPALSGASVFFLDRVSRATLTLATEAAAHGALVVFEPTSVSDRRLVLEAIEIAHVVKFADDRVSGIDHAVERSANILVEVKTRGRHGLEYRHRFGRHFSAWNHLRSVPVRQLADTCGSGDWCTAGLIARTAIGGVESFRRGGARELRAALRYGQALAAWNCSFEGARGGMYSVSREVFERQTSRLLGGEHGDCVGGQVDAASTAAVACPNCSERV